MTKEFNEGDNIKIEIDYRGENNLSFAKIFCNGIKTGSYAITDSEVKKIQESETADEACKVLED